MAAIELKVPDIGDFKDVEIIEILIKAGDTISVEQSLITVESDKASMEIPASMAGKIELEATDDGREEHVIEKITQSATLNVFNRYVTPRSPINLEFNKLVNSLIFPDADFETWRDMYRFLLGVGQ